ncbi:PRTRC system protein E [Mucilaginibacter rubeus]|uniref:PRTRC system protein E n=1 Tax=Mucilaginibacter rubeus TaxID=2027860 RepID=A0A5C1I2M4_9SPHI|nr:PRTRC system protein E [Mucilaginibacter rubeus]QEM12447.1 PRTRC system protein E [Mucilaginibacter rubeus]
MKTNFFEQISTFAFEGNMLLNIHNDNKGQLTVSVVLRNGEISATAGNTLPPMTIGGTATELDEAFFTELTTPVKQTIGLIHNLETYQKELDKAKNKNPQNIKKAKAAIEIDEDNDSDEPDDLFARQADDKQAKAEKKRLYDEAMEKAKELAKQMKYTEALAQLPDPAEYPEQAEVLNKKRREIQTSKETYDKLTQQFND